MRLRCHILRRLVLEVPYAVFVGGGDRRGSSTPDHGVTPRTDGLDPHLETVHIEEQIRIIRGVQADEGVVPVQRGDAARQAVLYIPEYPTPEIHVRFQKAHAAVPRPTAFVLVFHRILVVGIGVFDEVSLHQIIGLRGVEAEEHVDLVEVTCVEANGVGDLGLGVGVGEALVGALGGGRRFQRHG